MKLKRPILLDAFLLTIMVFLFMFLVSVLFPIKLKVFHPIKDAFSDFDYTDFYFSKLKKEADVSDDIIVVDVGHLSRLEIAHQLEVVSQGKPKAIGLDAIFYDEKDSIGDMLLEQVIKTTPSLVGINRLDSFGIINSHPRFTANQTGYANLYGEDIPEKVIRYFSMSSGFKKRELSFTATLASLVDSTFIELVDIFDQGIFGADKLKINYRSSTSFITLTPYEVFAPDFDPEIFKNRIVLMGYTGNFGDIYDMEDQHFTPMNAKIAGRSLPDMKGIYIHASILQSLLNRDFIRNAYRWLEMLLTVIITFLTSWLMIYYYVHKARWFHFMSKMVQLFAGVIFLFVSIWIMDVYHVKINFTLLFVALVLCADLAYFYDPIAKWMSKRNWFHSEIMKH